MLNLDIVSHNRNVQSRVRSRFIYCLRKCDFKLPYINFFFVFQQIKRKIELKAREKNRKKFQRKLRKMHQLAMANAAAANR